MNPTVLITGASSGIGFALAREFHRRGCFVIATSRSIDALQEFRTPAFRVERLDVTDADMIKLLAGQLDHDGMRPDILVNNAGYGLIGPAMEFTDAELKHQYETNLFGLMSMIRVFGPSMCERRRGLIINIGSISGITPLPYSGVYASTKAAVHAISDSLRMELTPFNVRVMVVQPGGVESNFGNVSAAKVGESLKAHSLYRTLEAFIRERARISQVGAMPAPVFARRVVDAALRKRPPAILRAGSRSFTLPMMKRWLPESLLDKIAVKRFGLGDLKDASSVHRPH